MLTLTAEAHAARGAAAVAGARACEDAAVALFRAGGKDLLHEAGQRLLREGVTEAAGRALQVAAPKLLARAADEGARQLATSAAREGARLTAKQAAGQVLASAGGAMGLGATLDAGLAAIDAARGLYRGDMRLRDAAAHVVREGATGGLATGAGVLAAAGLVALTGPLGAGTLAVVAGGTSLAAKAGLSALRG